MEDSSDGDSNHSVTFLKKMEKKKKIKKEKRKKEKKKTKEKDADAKQHKPSNSEKNKKKRTRTVSTSESEEEKPVQKKPKVGKDEREFVEAQFRFFKVGKNTPTKEFTTLMRSPQHLTLDALKKELLATQIGGLDVIRKMPAYDISVYVQKGEKRFAANTAEQWKVVGSLLLDPKGSLLVDVHGRLLSTSAVAVKKRKPPVKSETKNNAEYEQQLRSFNIGDGSYPTWVPTVEQE